MSGNRESVEGFAELFHHYYSALAPDFGCPPEEKAEWDELMPNERRRLVAATRLALIEVDARESCQPPPTVAGREGTEGRECGC